MLNTKIVMSLFLLFIPILSNASLHKFHCAIYDIIDVHIAGISTSDGEITSEDISVQIMDVFYTVDSQNIKVNRIENENRNEFFKIIINDDNSKSNFIKIISKENGVAITNMLFKGISFENKKTTCRFD